MDEALVQKLMTKVEIIADDMHELKELNVKVVELMKDNALLKQELISSNAKHDEGRKVLHKRLDAYARVGFWFGASLFTAMGGVIMVLVEKILS